MQKSLWPHSGNSLRNIHQTKFFYLNSKLRIINQYFMVKNYYYALNAIHSLASVMSANNIVGL